MQTNDQCYWIDEGTLTLPDGFEDRTTNILVQGDVEKSSLNLNIARDRFRTGETLEKYVTRQIGVMKEKISGYKLASRIAAQLGTEGTAIAGEQVNASYKNANRTIYQRQAAFPLSDTRVLIFSATSGSPFGEQSNTLWANWLASFTPRAAVENPVAPQDQENKQD